MTTLRSPSMPASNPAITVLVPVLGRPNNVSPLIKSFLEGSNPNTGLIFIVEDGDTDEEMVIHEVTCSPNASNEHSITYAFPDGSPRIWAITVDPRARRWSAKLNEAHRHLDRLRMYASYADDTSSGDRAYNPEWYLLGADDLHFHKGWDGNEQLRALMSDPAIGVIGTNDLHNPAVVAGKHATHPLVRRSYVEENGIEEGLNMIAPECYHHNFVDNEIVGLAHKRNAYAHCHESIVEHLHPVWGKGELDDTYRLGISQYRQDEKLFKVREMMYAFPKIGER